MTAIKTIDNYVGGAWITAVGAPTADVANPATGDVLARVSLSGADAVDAAVAAARSALPVWREVSVVRREDLARSVTAEMGKTLDDARAEVTSRYCSGDHVSSSYFVEA